MNRFVSALTALSLVFSYGTAQAQNCDKEILARHARAYHMQAQDMQVVADSFKEMHEGASKDHYNSVVLAVGSMALLFIAESMVAAEGASSYGIVGKAGAAHSNFMEGTAQFIANRIQNQFLSGALIAASPAITMPPVSSVVAWTILDLQNRESKVAEKLEHENKILITMSEEQIKSRIEVLRQQQSALIEKAPNQLLDGLTLGALDNAWTLTTYQNMQLIADLYKQLANLKTTELLQCK
nr:hypothetical protein [uncultured Bdellovibrio sp.]